MLSNQLQALAGFGIPRFAFGKFPQNPVGLFPVFLIDVHFGQKAVDRKIPFVDSPLFLE